MFMQSIEFDDAPKEKDMVIGIKLGKKDRRGIGPSLATQPRLMFV